MKSIETKTKRIVVGKIEPDEDLIDAIISMINKHKITSGLINCIGALKKFTIGYFDIASKRYLTKTFDDYVELISCIGNISFKNGEPIIHLHISIGTRNFNITGGHLLQPSIVSVTGEVYILEFEKQINRSNDPQFNLSLLDL
ncbi:MAG: PPC domain-containing DNA-binding protein [Promethearchaeota archaeon]